jgi:hypothetical protein
MGTFWIFSERRSAVTTISWSPPDSCVVGGGDCCTWATTEVAAASSRIPLTTLETDCGRLAAIPRDFLIRPIAMIPPQESNAGGVAVEQHHYSNRNRA